MRSCFQGLSLPMHVLVQTLRSAAERVRSPKWPVADNGDKVTVIPLCLALLLCVSMCETAS